MQGVRKSYVLLSKKHLEYGKEQVFGYKNMQKFSKIY